MSQSRHVGLLEPAVADALFRQLPPLESFALRETCKKLSQERKILSPRNFFGGRKQEWRRQGPLDLCVHEGNMERFTCTVGLGYEPTDATMRIVEDASDTDMVR